MCIKSRTFLIHICKRQEMCIKSKISFYTISRKFAQNPERVYTKSAGNVCTNQEHLIHNWQEMCIKLRMI